MEILDPAIDGNQMAGLVFFKKKRFLEKSLQHRSCAMKKNKK